MATMASAATAGARAPQDDWRGRGLTALTVVAALLNFFPIYWIINTSIKQNSEILAARFTRSFRPPSPSCTTSSLTFMPYGTYFMNSVIVAVATMIVTLLASSLGAYALARMQFPGRNLLGRAMLFAYTVPSVLLVIPHSW